MITFPKRSPLSRAVAYLCLGAAALSGAACQTQTSHEHASNPALRRIEAPANASKADADRAALARFVGVWSFDGWSADSNGAHAPCSGAAAATIENGHFVLIDLQATTGQLGARAGGKSGSMLLASEPGVGATMTAWGNASPSISRLVGRVEGNGSAFVFDEVKTPADRHRLCMDIVFETDDKWVAEIHDASASGHPVLARYQFTRSSN